jgi:uncharacterized protein
VSARTYDLNRFFLVADNPISREGVFNYSGGQIGADDKSRIYKVYRPADELAAPDTLDSFKLMPIIDDHTMLGEDFTPAEDVGVHGVIGENVKVTDGVMTANLKIFSSSLAQKIKSGKTELSCGYRCVYDFTPGEWNGEKYDAVQRQIRGNHLALVNVGRMGPQVAILDHMVFTVDAKELEPAMDEELKAMLAAIVARLDKLEAGETAEAAAGDEEKPDGEKPPVADEETPKEEAAGATDEDMPDGEKAADMEEPDKANAMDAMTKEIKALRKQVAGMVVMDEAAVVSTLARKSGLAERLAVHVGVFDHSAMTFDGVVKYGVDKLGLKDIPKGGEAVALDAALQVAKAPTPYTTATDGKKTALASSLAAYAGAA